MGDEGGDQNGALMSDPVDVIIEKLLRSVSVRGRSSNASCRENADKYFIECIG
jgi:hypothetical protein